jgi:poly(A) polymerase
VKPDSAVDIVRKLRDHGHEAYFVGGCVRDMVLGIEPSDYDIATSAHPFDVIQLFPRTESIGAQFGVVLVIHKGHPFEVATFRSDEAYLDGRRPSGVVFTTAREDVMRRDFTINGLLYDPMTEEIIDYVEGQSDIRAGIIRAIGDPLKRFSEDKLRVLRAVRFSARFNYRIEERTWAAMREMAPLIHQVSHERIREELVRTLTEGDAAEGVRMMHDSNLLAAILPEVAWSKHLLDSMQQVRRGGAPDFATAVLLHETPPARVTEILERLKFSRAESQHVLSLVENLPRFVAVDKMSTSELKRFFRHARFEDHLELARIHGETAGYEFAATKFRGWSSEEIAPASLISGEDLIAIGMQPGPRFKEILTKVEDEQLEGRLSSREQAMDFVKREFRA